MSYTIDEAFEYFLNLKKSIGVRDDTFNEYSIIMGWFRQWLDEKYSNIKYVDGINTQMIREYAIYLKEEHWNERKQKYGLSPYTVNVRLRFIKAFFNALFEEDIINENPVRNIKLMKVDEDIIEPLTDEELKKLLVLPDDKYYAQFRDKVAMYVMLDTGIRVNELCELEVKDIDFKTRSIIIPATKSKNRKPRILPLTNQVNSMLLELITENKTHFDSDYVFLSYSGTQYKTNSFRKRLYDYGKKAGIEKRVSPHVFRHMFCRNYILNGGDIFSLQRIVGHADISTTRKYIQLDDKAIRNQHSLYSPVLTLRKGKK